MFVKYTSSSIQNKERLHIYTHPHTQRDNIIDKWVKKSLWEFKYIQEANKYKGLQLYNH